ncbi:MAG: CYTH domain-containing protein [Minisyncoccota bacterium]
MQTYEVEIKSLLGNPENAQKVRDALIQADPSCTILSRNKQRNHYFIGGELLNLAEVMREHLSVEAAARLDDLAAKATDFSVRTRDKDGQVLLVVKASLGADSSANGVARLEFEEWVQLTLEELDALVLSAGFTYQAKWSREREEYVAHGINITLDKNAGYGWLAEFEKVVDDATKVTQARSDIEEFMKSIGVRELPQDRLERMFAFYNAHWSEYYGTDNIFTID